MSTSEPKRAYHHGNLRATLIELGLAALEEHPEADLSLRDLARQAGVSPNAVYRHFADKEALLAALAAEGFRLLVAESVEADHGIDPTDARRLLKAYGLAYVRSARRRPALFKLMFGRFNQKAPSDELNIAGALAYERLRERVARFAERDIDDPEVQIGTLSAWSLAHGLSNLVLDGLIPGDVDTAIAGVLALLTTEQNNKRS